MDKHKTDVIFRTIKEDGQVIAVFPHVPFDFNGNMTSYMHIGQHSASSYPFYRDCTVPSEKSAYKALKRELEDLGYNLQVRKRRNHDKFSEAFRERRALDQGDE